LEAQAAALRLEADALEAETAGPVAVALYMTVRDFAHRVAVSERTVWNLVAKGLPTVGQKRGRRVDVESADEWLRQERDHVDDGVERAARVAARTAASRAAGGRA
jgi:hypothetical protein